MDSKGRFLQEALELFAKHGVTSQELRDAIDGPSVPVSAFSSSLTVLESVCVYLRDATSLSPKSIAQHIKRPLGTVHNALANATKKIETTKKKKTVYNEDDALRIPMRVFSAQLTPTEAVIHYLIDGMHISNAEVARLLGRDPRNTHKQLVSARKKAGGVL